MLACSPPNGEDDGVMHVKALFLCGLLTNLSYWQLRLFDRYLGTTTLYESSYKLQILKKFLWCAKCSLYSTDSRHEKCARLGIVVKTSHSIKISWL